MKRTHRFIHIQGQEPISELGPERRTDISEKKELTAHILRHSKHTSQVATHSGTDAKYEHLTVSLEIGYGSLTPTKYKILKSSDA